MDHLDHRCQAVGRARSGRDNPVLGWIEAVMIDAHDDVERARGLDRRGHHHALHTLAQVWPQHVRLAELARSLDYQVATGPDSGGQLPDAGNPTTMADDDLSLASRKQREVPPAV